jgi:hypothetical protein
MTIKEASTIYGISTQAIYKRLTKKGYDLKQLKDSSGALTEEGERIIDQLFDRVTVTGEGDPTPQPTKKKPQKPDATPSLQAEKEVAELKAKVAEMTTEIGRLQSTIDNLREERDFLRHALNQSQQIQAMTLRALPPAPTEKGGLFAKLAARFKKPTAAAEQTVSNDPPAAVD